MITGDRHVNDRHACPCCTETFADRTDLRVHLEVTHRKSELVTTLLESREDVETSVSGESQGPDEARPTPSAD